MRKTLMQFIGGAFFGFGLAGAVVLASTFLGHGFLWRNGVYMSDESFNLVASLALATLVFLIAGAFIGILHRR